MSPIDPAMLPDGHQVSNLFAQLGIGGLMLVATTAFHGAGLFGMSRLLRIEREFETRFTIDFNTLLGLGFTVAMVLAIFVLHFVEITGYALLYWLVGALPDLTQSLYLSTITFGTVGYDDNGLDQGWRMVAAMEGINGIVLLGWSTAFFVRTIGRISSHGG